MRQSPNCIIEGLRISLCIPTLSIFYSKVIHWYLWPIHQHSDNSYPQGLHFPSRGLAITETVRNQLSSESEEFFLEIKHVLRRDSI